MIYNLVKILSEGRRVKFDYYKDGNFWYSTLEGFQFPVPYEEVKYSTMPATGNVTSFAKYVKKQFHKQFPKTQ